MSILFADLIALREWTTIDMSPVVEVTRSVADVELILNPLSDYRRDVLYCLPWQSSLYDPAVDSTIRRSARDGAAGLLVIRGDTSDIHRRGGDNLPWHLAELAERLHVNIGICHSSQFSEIWTAVKQRIVSAEFSHLHHLNSTLDNLRRFVATCISVEEFVDYAAAQLGMDIRWESQAIGFEANYPVRIANETVGYLAGNNTQEPVLGPLLGVIGELAAAIHLADVSRLQMKSHYDSSLLRMILDNALDQEALAITYRRARLNPDAPTRIAVLTMRYGIPQEDRGRFWDPVFLELEQSNLHRSARILTGYVSGYPTILLQNTLIRSESSDSLRSDVEPTIRKLMGENIIMGLSSAAALRRGGSALFQEAVEAATIGRALDRSNAIVRFEGLGDDRVFYMLLTSPFAMQLARSILYPLVKADTEQGTDHVKTVAAYLSNDRNLSETATQLHMHRNSVRYRLSQSEQLLGFTFNETERVLLLQLAVLSHRLQGDKFIVDTSGADH